MPWDLENLVNINAAEKLDSNAVSNILSTPPFLQVEGLFNLRDISDGTQPSVKQGYSFRCGSLERITEHGKDELKQLGVKTIFDLRSARETSQFPDPEIDGIETVAAQTNTDPLATVQYSDLVEMYMEMLETHKSVWSTILRHVRDHPDRPLLVHCTAGKDRTGVAAALILGIAGMPSSYIDHEYSLTRIGIEPVRELLLSKLTGGKPEEVMKSEKLQKLSRMDPEIINEFQKEVERRFEGVEGYVVNELGFTKDDVETMRKSLQ